MDEAARLLALIEGVVAANIFDWGSKACVDLYQQGTIIEIYRMSRKKMQHPWRIDDFDMFKKRMLKKDQPYKRALISVDNSVADVVLRMLPLARELLRHGIEMAIDLATRRMAGVAGGEGARRRRRSAHSSTATARWRARYIVAENLRGAPGNTIED